MNARCTAPFRWKSIERLSITNMGDGSKILKVIPPMEISKIIAANKELHAARNFNRRLPRLIATAIIPTKQVISKRG